MNASLLMSIEELAEYLGISEREARYAVQSPSCSFGYYVKAEGNQRGKYIISRKLVKAYFE